MWFYIDSMEKTHTHKKNRREDHGGWRRAHCRNAHVLHCLLKSSCLLICFHSWSLDLSQTLIQTIQILKEGKNWSKTMEKTKKKFHPMSPVQLPLRPSPWVQTFCFFVFFWFSRGCCHLGPKMSQNPWTKKSFTPCHLSSFSSDPLHGSKLFVFSFFGVLDVFATLAQKCTKTYGKKKFHPMSPVQLPLRPSPWVETFFFWFSRGCCHLGPKMSQNPWKKTSFTPCHLSSFPSDPLHGSKLFVFFCFLEVAATANNISCSFFVFLVFLFLGFLGEIFTSIGTAFNPSTFYIDVFIELLILATEPSEKMYSKNSSTLSPTSLGTPLDWCFIGMPRFWFLMFRGLARVLQTWNH